MVESWYWHFWEPVLVTFDMYVVSSYRKEQQGMVWTESKHPSNWDRVNNKLKFTTEDVANFIVAKKILVAINSS